MSVLTLAGWISLVFLAIGAFGAFDRIIRGPALLDRAIAVDVILIVLSSGLAVWMALNQSTDFVIVVVVASLIGFISSATLPGFRVKEAQATKQHPDPNKGHTGVT